MREHHTAVTGKWDKFFENAAAFTKGAFAVSAAFLVGSAYVAASAGGGIANIGANGLFQGFVQSNNAIGISGGLTIGSSSIFSGSSAQSTASAGGLLGAHEYGHTLQFIGISALMGLDRNGTPENAVASSFTLYSVLGVWGLTPAGAFWEQFGSFLGGL